MLGTGSSNSTGGIEIDVNRQINACTKRVEQLRKWSGSETNRSCTVPRTIDMDKSRIKFQKSCMFLAAASAGDKDEVVKLLEKGVDIDTMNIDGLTALHQVCIDGDEDMVKFLLKYGAYIDMQDYEGWTPLHAAASCDHYTIVKLLINNYASLSLCNNDGDLPLDIAESDDIIDLIRRKMNEQKINADHARNAEETLMIDHIKQYLNKKHYGNLNYGNHNLEEERDHMHPITGATALHVAAAKGYMTPMKLLIECGANIDAKDVDGWTGLHAAAHWGVKEAVDLLADSGANFDIKNIAGQTPLDVCDEDILLQFQKAKQRQSSNGTIGNMKRNNLKNHFSQISESTGSFDRLKSTEKNKFEPVTTTTIGTTNYSLKITSATPTTTSITTSHSSYGNNASSSQNKNKLSFSNRLTDSSSVVNSTPVMTTTTSLTHSSASLKTTLAPTTTTMTSSFLDRNKTNRIKSIGTIESRCLTSSVTCDALSKYITSSSTTTSTIQSISDTKRRLKSYDIDQPSSGEDIRNKQLNQFNKNCQNDNNNNKDNKKSLFEKNGEEDEEDMNLLRSWRRHRLLNTMGSGNGENKSIFATPSRAAQRQMDSIEKRIKFSLDVANTNINNNNNNNNKLKKNINGSSSFSANILSSLRTSTPSTTALAALSSVVSTSSSISTITSSVSDFPVKFSNSLFNIPTDNERTAISSSLTTKPSSSLTSTRENVKATKTIVAGIINDSQNNVTITTTLTTINADILSLTSNFTNSLLNERSSHGVDGNLLNDESKGDSSSLPGWNYSSKYNPLEHKPFTSRCSTTHSPSPMATSASAITTAPSARNIGNNTRRADRWTDSVSRQDESAESQRKARSKRARETRRSTQGVTQEQIKEAEARIKQQHQQSEQQTKDNENDVNKDEVDTEKLIRLIESANPNGDSTTAKGKHRRSTGQIFWNEKTLELEKRDVTDNINKNENNQNLITSNIRTTTTTATTTLPPPPTTTLSLSSSLPNTTISSSSPNRSALTATPSGRSTESPIMTSTYASRYTRNAFDPPRSTEDTKDYKTLYERAMAENEKITTNYNELQKNYQSVERKLSKMNTPVTTQTSSFADRKEKRALERRIAELEEEVKEKEKLKAEIDRLKDENRALTRVCARLSR
ncbi:hypothetical protein SNEBB_000255 [Seison nebaliae]|nr:hypothetical protein SNEBB_000255 [Seison nebaliae]